MPRTKGSKNKKSEKDEQRYVLSEKKYFEMLEQIIDKFPEFSHINAEEILIISDIATDNRESEKKIIYADVCRFNKRFKDLWEQETGNKKQYILTIYEAHIEDMDESQIALLLYHEMCHIGENGKLLEHTLMDFYNIIEKFGASWIKTKGLKNILDKDFSW